MRFALVFLAFVAIPLASLWAAGERHATIRIVDQNGAPVRDAVVEIDYPAHRAGRITFPWRMAMAQRNEQFVPGTLVIAKGSTVAFPNLDRVRHSVYSFSKPARFEFDLYGRDQTRSQRFPIAGTVAVGCNIHDAMRGYIRIVETPFAGKTDANGLLRVSGVPAGRATVTVWHPQLRTPGNEASAALEAAASSSRQTMSVRLRR